METFKPTTSFLSQAALLATVCFISPLIGGELNRDSGRKEGKSTANHASLDEAQELLRKGDEAYTAGRYSDAIEAYAGAGELIPNEPATAELKTAATERHAQASVEHARFLSRKGDVAGAKAIVDQVLQKSTSSKNSSALAFRAQLDDPIRTNPALTVEHAKNVDSVRRRLYTAQGAYDLGKFDEAKSTYEDVLRIDPTNTAARRGMEQVAAAKSAYQKSAYDNTRSEMLSDVTKQWELPVPPTDSELSLLNPDAAPSDTSLISIKDKLDRIIIPKIALDQSTLQETLDFLRVRAVENDTLESDPARKGVNFTVNLGAADSPLAVKIRDTRFDLQLSQLPLSQVLKYITEISNTTYRTDDYSVIIAPVGSISDDLISRTYRVPPDFISSISAGNAESGAAGDPFGKEPAAGLLPKRQSVQEALKTQGVSFPEGATASYIPGNNTLRVVNTATNLDYITQIVETVGRTEPVIVTVRVTMIKVEQTRLEELGFDWLLDNFGFAGEGPFGSKLNLGGGTRGNGDGLSDIELPPESVTRNPITAGNRSGDGAILGNSIDSVLGNRAGRQERNRAPGVFGVRGKLNDANIQMLMRGLDQKKGVDLMAQPAIATRSGQASSVSIVREFIYPTEYEPPELPQSTGGNSSTIIVIGGAGGGGIFGGGSNSTSPVTPATPTAFDKKDVGVTLEVLPVVDANKQYVTLTLTPTFSDFDGFVNYGSPINAIENGLLGPEQVEITPNAILQPVFSKQTMNTTVDIADGATLVLGGLLQEAVQNVEDKTPVLGSIPILGRLFQSKVRKPISTAIVFLVNTQIQDPTGRSFSNR